MLFPFQGKLVYSDSLGCGTAMLGKPFVVGICSAVGHTPERYSRLQTQTHQVIIPLQLDSKLICLI